MRFVLLLVLLLALPAQAQTVYIDRTDPGGGGGAFVVGHVLAAANTSTGDQAFTIAWSDAGAHTPDCAVITTSVAATDDTPVANLAFSIGAVSSTSARWAISAFGTDAADPMDEATYSTDAGLIALPSSVSALDFEADAASTVFSSNTVTINISNAPTTAVMVHVVAFAGADGCAAGTINPPDSDTGTVNATPLSAAANAGILVSGPRSIQFGEAFQVGSQINTGLISYDGSTFTQRASLQGCRDDVATSVCGAVWLTDAAGATVHNGVTIEQEFSASTHANGITITAVGSDDAADQSHIGYLLLDLPAGTDALAGDGTSPTSVGTKDFTVGFQAQGVFVAGTANDRAADSYETGGDGDGHSWGFAMSSSSFSAISVEHEDAAAAANTQSLVADDELYYVTTRGGTTYVRCDLDSFQATAVRIDCSTVQTSGRRLLFLAFEE